MKIDTLCKKGNRNINEDACVVNEKAGIFAVIDGATGLDGVPGYVASQAVQKVLDEATAMERLDTVMEAANRMVGNKTIHHLGLDEDGCIVRLPKLKRSTCAAAAVSLDMNRLSCEYVHAADCMIFLQYENGDIRTVTYDLLHHFDEKAINEIVKLRKMKKLNVDIAEARELVKPILSENRSKLNTTDGYSVIDGSDDAMDHVESGRLSLKKVTGILLLSDGLLLPTELGENNAWEQSALIAFNDGLDGLMHEVEKRENSDPQCVHYPRLKMKDDKTGLRIMLDS
ncbi:hypothetical protein GCM10009001_04530 [Virgibacillus siamensis]|uniref:PPM-type phosphatase domain-containing protein n=1 Tax=Virgibacillus siamensis TaxID=480071 RepID=A0ABN1FIJ2_9BACI